jgi:hypothetical protein
MTVLQCSLYQAIIFVTLITFGRLHVNAQQTQASTASFKKHIISKTFVSEGVSVGDVNNDGITDVLAGNYWYQAPAFNKHLLHVDTLNPVPGYSTTFLNFCMDVNRDGWIDLIRFDQPGGVCAWYENPKNNKGLWKSHIILQTAGNETPAFADVDLDGRMDLICNDNTAKQVLWLKSPATKEDTTWERYVISRDSLRGTHKYTHGLGWGDVNKDGKNDVLIKSGWWESPANVKDADWKFHAANFGEDCANMFVYDLDKDGDQDVITSSAHTYGIWWHEQKQEGNGNTSWVTHEIIKSFSQTHALAFKDMNADGHPDLITGKRYFAHNGKDPGAFEPAVVYWYQYKPGKDPQWIPHLIDNNSGIGTNFVVTDMNKDGLPDIITSNKKGVFFLEQLKPAANNRKKIK